MTFDGSVSSGTTYQSNGANNWLLRCFFLLLLVVSDALAEGLISTQEAQCLIWRTRAAASHKIKEKIKYCTVTLHSSPVWQTWPFLPSHPCLNPAGGSTCLCLSYKLNETTKKKPYESKLILPVTTKTETDRDLDELSC